jgi:hypothetical protein
MVGLLRGIRLYLKIVYFLRFKSTLIYGLNSPWNPVYVLWFKDCTSQTPPLYTPPKHDVTHEHIQDSSKSHKHEWKKSLRSSQSDITQK